MPRGVRNIPKEDTNIENTVAEAPVTNTVDPPQASQPNDNLAKQNKELMEQLAKMQAEIEAMKQNGGKVVMAKPEENVDLAYIAAVSPNNVLSLGEYGTLNGVGGYIEVPRKEFGGKFLTPEVRGLLNARRLIVLNGVETLQEK